jgi:hypothetical protein
MRDPWGKAWIPQITEIPRHSSRNTIERKEPIYDIIQSEALKTLFKAKHLMPRREYSYSEVFGYFGSAVDEC